MRAKTFADRFCEANALPTEQFAPVVLKMSLYPHARWCGWLVAFFNRRHFEADYDFVNDAGRLMRFRDFDLAVNQFLYHPANRGWLRRTLNIRVSAQRLRRIVRETLRSQSADNAAAAPAVPAGSMARVPLRRPIAATLETPERAPVLS